MTEVHCLVAPNQQIAMQGLIDGSYPISELIHSTALNLPMSYFHSKDDMLRVCEAMNRWIKSKVFYWRVTALPDFIQLPNKLA